jgi:hypothetical protein
VTTTEQRRVSLEHANSHRLHRAQWKRDVRAGQVNATVLLTTPEPWAASMKLYDALIAIPTIGPQKAGTILKHTRISANRPLGGMTEHERGVIVSILTSRGWCKR